MRPLAPTILGGVAARLGALAEAPRDEFSAFELRVLSLGAATLTADAEDGTRLRSAEHRELARLLRAARARGHSVDVSDACLDADLSTVGATEADRLLARVQQATIDLHARLEETAPHDSEDARLLDETWATLASCNGLRRRAR